MQLTIIPTRGANLNNKRAMTTTEIARPNNRKWILRRRRRIARKALQISTWYWVSDSFIFWVAPCSLAAQDTREWQATLDRHRLSNPSVTNAFLPPPAAIMQGCPCNLFRPARRSGDPLYGFGKFSRILNHDQRPEHRPDCQEQNLDSVRPCTDKSCNLATPAGASSHPRA